MRETAPPERMKGLSMAKKKRDHSRQSAAAKEANSGQPKRKQKPRTDDEKRAAELQKYIASVQHYLKTHPAPTDLGFTLRKLAAWAVDYLLGMGLAFVFGLSAWHQYQNGGSQSQAILMVALAVTAVIVLTVLYPVTSWGNQTVGAALLRVTVVNRSGEARTYPQCFLYECLCKLILGPVFAVACIVHYIAAGIIGNNGKGVELLIDRLFNTVEMPVNEAARPKN